MSLSLYAIQALFILDSSGKRIFSKYYTAPHIDSSEHTNEFQTTEEELAFEKAVFKKTWKTQNDVSVVMKHKVVAVQTLDMVFYVVGSSDENEMLLYECVCSVRDALELLLKGVPDKKTLLENYGLLVLTVDETIDDGIILESDPVLIAGRVTKAPTSDAQALVSDIKEMGFMSSLQKARDKFAERILRGAF
ncbi:coatomer zeta subunit [Schizosaccharomyces japonicus yFS275]|uniref:Coatomer subunit zeta n=1 Tax=Schizosaccharomyces japonicus (strain yFS275 / FY16936) TaxID=402676 RepID=B6K6X4_SCHJY|nr:coatomer zeta subunit [Schizosaccharomyces japonicus yFS275]EEB09278.1 coatomer zeta subunit [Schizosaccharomyces japonicus yFS275]